MDAACRRGAQFTSRGRVRSSHGMHHGQAICEIVKAGREPDHLERLYAARCLTLHLVRPKSNQAFAWAETAAKTFCVETIKPKAAAS